MSVQTNNVYNNQVIVDALNEQLNTKLDFSRFLTVDNSLSAEAGMSVKINTYTISGSAEAVNEGSGNTSEVSVSFAPTTHTVITSQAKGSYTDEAAMSDPNAIDKLVNGISTALVNKFNADAVAALGGIAAGMTITASNFSADCVWDAIAKMNLEDDDENGLVLLVNPANKAEIRKALADELKYVEDFQRVGYIGTLGSVSVYTSKLVPADTGYCFNPSAITAFVKKSAEVEMDRDIDTRINVVVARMVNVIALTDATKAVKIDFSNAA